MRGDVWFLCKTGTFCRDERGGVSVLGRQVIWGGDLG